MFVSAQLLKNGINQDVYPVMNRQENMIHRHMEYWSSVKKNKIMKFISEWMEMERV